MDELQTITTILNAGGILAFAVLVYRLMEKLGDKFDRAIDKQTEAITKSIDRQTESVDAHAESCGKLHDAIIEMKGYRRARTDPGSMPPVTGR